MKLKVVAQAYDAGCSFFFNILFFSTLSTVIAMTYAAFHYNKLPWMITNSTSFL